VARGGGDTSIGTPIEGGVEMTSADLGTTNAWLAVIAIASLVQSLVIIGLVVAVFRLVRRTESAVEEVKREYLDPITTRTNKVIGEVEDALARFRSMDDRVSGAIHKTSEGLSAVATVAKQRFWPVVGVVRGLRAIAGAVADRRRQSRALVELDQDAQQRFSYEGGSHARTSNVR
jgi:uncharacterized protein YoxC